MKSYISMKIISRRFALTSAAILISAHTVLADTRVDEAQMQARDLLSGTVGGRTKVIDKSPGIPADHREKSYRDPQEQARQLILGKPSFEGTADRRIARQSKTKVSAASSTRQNIPVHTDSQEQARRMILGAGSSGN
jgi:hypothetical protein